MTFLEKLDKLVDKNNSLLCVGLDPDISKLPASLLKDKVPYFAFNKAIIDATADLVCAYKPNSAFYEALGADGIEQLQKTCNYIHDKYPEVPIILDFKRGDIGNTNVSYAKFAFDYLGVDAITIQPYQGRQAVQPFLDYKDKGIIILCKTSNPGAEEFQDLLVNGIKQYQYVAAQVRDEWNVNKNCLLVAGATYPEELAELRTIVGDMSLLIPGIGAQGGDIKATVKAGQNSRGQGMIINSSRGILFASSGPDFATVARFEAKKLRDLINQYRKR